MKYSRVVQMYRQAIQYARRGWRVLPIQRKSKRPLTTHGLNDATCDLHQIRQWYLHFYREANIAIATGKCSRVLVLDIDNRNRGDRTLEELIATHGPLPETLEASTGGGGRHIFFKYPEDIEHLAGGNHRLGQGIDFKGDGGYVVVPPSIHPSGNEYRWSKGPHDIDLAAMPPSMLNQIVQKTTKQFPALPIKGNCCSPIGNQKVLEGYRNDHLFKLACRFARFGISLKVIEVALLAHNDEHCDPPLPASEVKRIAKSAERYDANPIAQNSIRPDPKTKKVFLDESNCFAPVTLSDLLAEPEVPVQWVSDGYLARGRWTLLAGQPKIGKTTLTYEGIVAVAEGVQWLNRPVWQGKVLVLAVEEHVDDIKRRFRELVTADGAKNIKVVASPLEFSPIILNQLVEYIQREDIRLVVVDTLPAWWNVENENDNAEMLRNGKLLLEAIRKSDAAWLTLAHHRKSGGEDGKEVRGGSALLGLVDINVSMKRCRGNKGPERMLETMSRLRETPKNLIIRYTDAGYRNLGSPTEFAAEAIGLKVWTCLSQAPQTVEELVKATGLTKHDVKKAIEGLGTQVCRTGKGVKNDPFLYTKAIPPKSTSTGGSRNESKRKSKPKGRVLNVA